MYVLRFFSWFFLETCLFVVPVLSLKKRLRGTLLYILLLTVAWLVYLVYIGGDGQPLFRFMVPVLPLVAVLVARGADDLHEGLSRFLGRLPIYRLTSVSSVYWGTWVLIVLFLAGTLAPSWHYKGLADASGTWLLL